METVNGLGQQNLIDYVLKNSGLKKNQFVFALQSRSSYCSFIVARNDELVVLGSFNFEKFILNKPPYDPGRELIAITRFLDLCINKFQDPSIVVPDLEGNSDYWNDCYK